MTVAFTGTGVKWISIRDDNHGFADVFLDGVKVRTVDLYGQQQNQYVAVTRQRPDRRRAHPADRGRPAPTAPRSTGNFVTIDAIDVTCRPRRRPRLHGLRSSRAPASRSTAASRKIIVADYDLGGNQLQYSTSEIMTNATIGGRDVAVLYGDAAPTARPYCTTRPEPTVTATGGDVTTTWDPATGDLRLNYRHNGLTRVQITGGDSSAAAAARRHRHRQDVLAPGHRGRPGARPRDAPAARRGQPRAPTLALTGDIGTDGAIEVFSAASRSPGTARRCTPR